MSSEEVKMGMQVHRQAVGILDSIGETPLLRLRNVSHGLEGLKHMATDLVPGIYDPHLADDDMSIPTEEAYAMVKRLAREEGLFVGVSSGAAMAGALRVAQEIHSGVIAVVFPDGGNRYLSSAFWKE